MLPPGAGKVLRKLPGTTRELAARTGFSETKVRRILNHYRSTRQVGQMTRHYNSLAYTFVYYRTPQRRALNTRP